VVCDADPSLGDVAVSTEDVDGVRAVARRADGIIAPGTDWPVRIAAYVAEDLGLPHPITPQTAVLATSKLAQRERLAAAGVAQPEWSAEPLPPPVVVKPADRQGQRGIAFLRTPAALDEAADRARRASRSGRVLYERWIDAPEVTVNGFSRGGVFGAITVTDREHFPGAPGVALRHVLPARSGAREAAEAAGAAVEALGIGEGPSYVQLLLADAGPLVVEVAARLGGGHDSELALRCAGVDLAAAAVRAAIGDAVAASDLEPQMQAAGVIEFLAAPPGRLSAARARPPAGARVSFYHRAGHRYGPVATAPDRAGYVVALGSHRDEALRTARAAARSTSFVTS
jgi:biotin carboxylase